MKTLGLLFCWVLFGLLAEGQGTSFSNLGFESANIPSLAPGQAGTVWTSNGMPGWTAYYDGRPGASIWENNVSLAGAAVAIEGPQSPSSWILFGNYTAYVIGDFNPVPGPHGTNWSAISQIGQVPQNARWLYFLTASAVPTVSPVFEVTLGNVSIPVTEVGSTSKYLIWQGDISAFAGMTEQLMFTALPAQGGFLDQITFSSISIPEPSTPAMAIVACVLVNVMGYRRKERRRPQRS